MTTILVAGFGPFPGAPGNPSAAIVRRIARTRRPLWAGHRIVTHVFGTRYDAVARDLPALVGKHRPQAVVLFGLAARTPYLRVETRARNRVTQLFPDAARRRPAARIEAGGPASLRGRAPFVRLASAARAAGADARLSRDAGAYVCNFAYWHAIRAAPALAVFVHVPKPRGPSDLNGLIRAAQAIVSAALSQSLRH